jgi:hypothetical protein
MWKVDTNEDLILTFFSYDSYAFNDFGSKFTCVDPTGENPLSGIVASIDKVSLAF